MKRILIALIFAGVPIIGFAGPAIMKFADPAMAADSPPLVAQSPKVVSAPLLNFPNLLVNGSFEVPLRYNGTTLRHFPSNDAAFLSTRLAEAARVWVPVATQGWLAEGVDAVGVEVVGESHTGARSLRITPQNGQSRSVISSLDTAVGEGPVTLTAWVKTQGAQGTLGLDMFSDWQEAKQGGAKVRSVVDLPSDTNWMRLTVSAVSPAKLAALCRLKVTSGSVWLDDVQIVSGTSPTPFNTRPQEWLRLGITGLDESGLPQRRAGDKTPLELTLTNDSRLPLTGKATIWFGTWDKPRGRSIASIDLAKLPLGATHHAKISLSGEAAGAYVFTVALVRGDTTIIDGANNFYPRQFTGGFVSNGAVGGRDALRLAIAPATTPPRIFGVNNGMLMTGNGGWFGGYDPSDFLEGSALGIDCARGNYNDDVGYAAAMGRMAFHAMTFEDAPESFSAIDNVGSAGGPGTNPAFPEYLDLSDPAGIARLTRRAKVTGEWLAQRPLVASYQMANETPQLNGGRLCPSPAADADFRSWCRQKYVTLAKANANWGTSYANWEEVEQIVSAKFLEEVKKQPQRTGAAAIDWTASSGQLSDTVVQRMQQNPGVAMDWMRWRTAVTLRSYALFRSVVKQNAPGVLISTNLCWPAFVPETTLPFYRAMDVSMLDIQYTSGLPRALGTPAEMMDGMEMVESGAPGKPVWGIETYYQPQWPAEYMAMQNWGMLAHGMSNNLVFAWKPYSDHGPVETVKAWEQPDAKPMWYMIDKDGTKLPAYSTFRRSHDEIAAYHRKYDGLSVKRAATDTAFYVSLDTAQYAQMQSGNKPWGSPWVRTRNNLIYLLRLQGIAVDYVDDQTLPDAPGKYQKIVVPASYVLSQSAAARLARFARLGGTVILAGPSGVSDPWLRPYANMGGKAWADLHWKAPKFAADYTGVSFQKTPPLVAAGATAAEAAPTLGGKIDETVAVGKEFRGVGGGVLPGAVSIQDAAGTTIGWRRAWGKGKLIAYGILPDTYTTDPHPTANLTAWTNQLIQLGGLDFAARWVGNGPSQAGSPGTGSPVVEVVARQKSEGVRLVYCLNQGGEGSGTVEVAIPPGKWTAIDVLTGQKLVGGKQGSDIWRMPLKLNAFGYAVIELRRAS